jgi:ATP phosphoribosyltransferase regulatory subunit
VARIAAARAGDALLPLRFSYEGPVLRHVPAQRGRSRQIEQLGAELLGTLRPEADAEVIAVVVACLKEAGLQEFKVDVGQVEFFKGVLRGVELEAEDAARLKDCVGRKDLSELEHLLEDLPLSDAKKRLLAELPLLAGGIETIDRAAALVESDHSGRALENLAEVVRLLTRFGVADCITVDLGELRGVDYHTGVIFEAFVHHIGSPLCKGGRYDRLIAAYGADLPATGFSLDLLALMEALRVHGVISPEPGGVLLADRGQADTVALGQRIRARGVRAAVDVEDRPLGQSVAYGREQGFAWVVALNTSQAGPGQALLVHLASGAEEVLPLDRIERRVAAGE